MKKKLVFIVVVIIILCLLKVFSLGGGGFGTETEDTSKSQETQLDQSDEIQEVIEEKEELSNVVIVTIKETLVFVGNKEFDNEAELKAYIEEVNNDEKEFQLIEENSILDTYEWATKVFNDLNIQLVPIKR